MNNELIINVTSKEVIIALLQGKQLIELAREKNDSRHNVGDIFLGKVKSIMTGLNASFVDIGQEKDGFLHYLDLSPQYVGVKEYLSDLKRDNKKYPLSNFKIKSPMGKEGNIKSVLKPGDDILVQITKERISTKGSRLTNEIFIAGRNMILMPFTNKVSISKKIENPRERDRLRKLLISIKPPNYGVIIRTIGQNKKVEEFYQELTSLVTKLEYALKRIRNSSYPRLILSENSRTISMLRDIFDASFNSIYVNDTAAYEDIKAYIKNIAPDKKDIVKLYNSPRVSIFDNFNVNQQIKKLFGKTITCKGGVYLVIEHTEALHVIDVNSGNRVLKGIDGQEENALNVNLIAAEEIARQLKLRDMGGIIVVDFIDMHDPQNQQILYEKMKEVMKLDRAKHNILPLSKFCVMEITRQRVRPELNIETQEICPTCLDSGKIQPPILIINKIHDSLEYITNELHYKNITLKVHPFIAAYLTKGFFSTRLKWVLDLKTIIKIVKQESNNYLDYTILDKEGKGIVL